MSGALLPVYPRLDLELVRAEGCWLYTADHRKILDLYGAHAVTPLGHAHPELTRGIADAFRAMDFYSNSLHMRVQGEAAEAVLGGSDHLRFAHFTNSGTEANEAALHLARRLTGRAKVLSFDCAFHGRTLASLAASGLPAYRARLSIPADPALNRFVPFGDRAALREIDDETAAVICESVPSLAGVHLPPEGYYPALATQCQKVGALLIFDEVQGGVGRLGHWFAHQRFGVRPDIVTLAKSVAAGYPVGVMATTAEIGEQVAFGELGTTFGGGPVACRMVSLVARLVQSPPLCDCPAEIHQRIAAGLASIEGVALRGAGCLMGVQTPRPAKELRDELLRRDILVGTSAHPETIRLLPAYVLQDAQIDGFLRAMQEIMA